ncbi:MAG: hypothetical protein GW839_07770, partial [Flavobacteriales bacterium]|nr:hypothetical protein [Flavobacteriales bacterium]
YLLTLSVIISCQHDENIISTSSESIIESKSISLINNRLYFSDKELFTEIYNKYADATEEELYSFLESYYKEGFLSLRPLVTEENEDFIFNRISTIYKSNILYKQSNKTSSQKAVLNNIIDDIDELEDIVGDETFAAFLNYDAEVQIENSIYKYTDTGLFVIPTENYENLGVYLDNQNISKTLLQPTDEIVSKTYITKNGINDLYTVDSVNKIQYFASTCNIADEVIQDCGSTSTGGGTSGDGGTSGGTTTTVDPLDGLQNFVDGLKTCSPSSGIFGDLFGTNKVCKDTYESGRRVKTKAFNYNYFIAYHAGVKVKHQKKGWTGLWRKENTDIVAMGASRISYDYDINPVLNSALSGLNLFETKISSKKYGKQWVFNTTAYTGSYNFYGIISQTNYSANLYPRAFQDDFIIETFGGTLLDKKELNLFFWKGAQQATEWLVKNKLTFDSGFVMPKERTLAYKSPQYGRILVQKSVFKNCSNCDIQDKTIDFGFSLKTNIGPDNNWSISTPSPGNLSLQPKRYSTSLYGVVKRGGQWHGSLIDF